MSAPPRNPRGGGQARGRSATPIGPKGHGRGTHGARRGRGRGAAREAASSPAEALLQGLQSGSMNQRTGTSARGSGEKHNPANVILESRC
jgi:hypothetical protein